MINKLNSEEVNPDIQKSQGNSGFIGTITYLLSLVMPFLTYLWLSFFR